MKKTILTLLVIIACTFTKAQSTLILQNNTNKTVLFAICLFEQENKAWTSIGWYKIEKYRNYTLQLNNYVGNIYIHGENTAIIKGEWGKGYMFCIDPLNQFRIINADKVNCNKRKEFSLKAINRGVNRFTFNP